MICFLASKLTTTSPSGTARTVIFIKIVTSVGQDVFLRGGFGHDVRTGKLDHIIKAIKTIQQKLKTLISFTCRNLFATSHLSSHLFGKQRHSKFIMHNLVVSGCTTDATTSNCALAITYNNVGSSSHYDGYNTWRTGDTKLDWYGAESSQYYYNSQAPEGSPCVWTSDQASSPGYVALNQ